MHLYAGKKHHKFLLTECPNDTLLTAVGVKKGMTVQVVTKQPMGGPIVIRVNQRDIALDKALASNILTKAVI